MRRASSWFAIAETSSNVGGPSGSVLFTGFSATALALRPFTIVRVRMNWHVASDQEIADEITQVALGMAVVSEQALAIGITAVPTGFTDQDSDLFFVYDVNSSRSLLVGAGANFLDPKGTMKDLDSRAMRKVDDGQDVALTLETSAVSNGAQVLKTGRMLVKLH